MAVNVNLRNEASTLTGNSLAAFLRGGARSAFQPAATIRSWPSHASCRLLPAPSSTSIWARSSSRWRSCSIPRSKGSAGPEHAGAKNRPEERRKYMLEIDNSFKARPSLNCGTDIATAGNINGLFTVLALNAASFICYKGQFTPKGWFPCPLTAAPGSLRLLRQNHSS